MKIATSSHSVRKVSESVNKSITDVFGSVIILVNMDK
jgi:hypothetical protein